LPAGRFDLKDAVAELKDGDVERTAAEVIDEHRGLALLVRYRRQARSAVGSLMIRSTSRPAMVPASFVACL